MAPHESIPGGEPLPTDVPIGGLRPIEAPPPECIPETSPFNPHYRLQGVRGYDGAGNMIRKVDADRRYVVHISEAIEVLRPVCPADEKLRLRSRYYFQCRGEGACSPITGPFSPPLDVNSDMLDDESFEVNERLDINALMNPAGKPPVIEVLLYREDRSGQPVIIGVVRVRPEERRAANDTMYEIEEYGQPGKVIGGLGVRLEGTGVGEGERQGPSHKDSVTRTIQEVECKTTMEVKEPEKPVVEIFLLRATDIKDSDFYDGNYYVELKVYTQEVRVERVRIKPQRGVFATYAPDGSVQWSWSDLRPQVHREVVYRDFYTQDPETGEVRSSYQEVAERVGPYRSWEVPENKDRGLVLVNMEEGVHMSSPKSGDGLALKVKLIASAHVTESEIGETTPIALKSAQAGPYHYDFHPLQNSSGRTVGSICLAARLVNKADVGAFENPTVRVVAGNWGDHSNFAMHRTTTERDYISEDQLRQRLLVKQPKLSAKVYGGMQISEMPPSDAGLGPFLINKLPPAIAGPRGVWEECAQSPAQHTLSWDVQGGGHKWVPAPVGPGWLNKVQREKREETTLPVDIGGLQTRQPATEYEFRQNQLQWNQMNAMPLWKRDDQLPMGPNGFSASQGRMDGAKYQHGGSVCGGGGDLTVPKPRKIEQYAQDMSTKRGAIPRGHEGCPVS